MNRTAADFPKIQSRDNQKLKFARRVREGFVADQIFVEGLRLCEEITKTNLEITAVFIAPEFSRNPRAGELIEKLLSKNAVVYEVGAKIFDSLADTKNSQGIALAARKPPAGKEIIENRLAPNLLLLLLHGINNPANLGAILRTAEAAGAGGVIVTKGTADVFSPKSLRAAMGAGFRLPVWSNADFKEILQWANANRMKTVCADVGGAKSYTEIDWNESKLLIFGSEGHGLTEAEIASTDESLLIPMENRVESLNVAVACAVILFEAKRQRDLTKNKG